MNLLISSIFDDDDDDNILCTRIVVCREELADRIKECTSNWICVNQVSLNYAMTRGVIYIINSVLSLSMFYLLVPQKLKRLAVKFVIFGRHFK